jgi:hypothetical protein
MIASSEITRAGTSCWNGERQASGQKSFMIRLFLSVYDEQCTTRRREYKKCLELNLQNAHIDQICILREGSGNQLPDHKKIVSRAVADRPTYRDYLEWIAELAAEEDVSIIANSDIYFDRQLKFFDLWNLPHDTALALSRWDIQDDGSAVLYDHNDSQDAWILKGKPRDVDSHFPIGVPRCDNRIAAELELAGYTVLNPAFSLRSFHLHDGAARPYLDSTHSEVIPPPYKYVWPHNLLGPLQTLLHNIRHPDSHLYWRFDRRNFSRWLPVRAVNKAIRSVRI